MTSPDIQTGVHTEVLLVRVPGAVCALPLESVMETMRPLPVQPFSGMPDFVRGVALIRGAPAPVIDLGALFDAPQAAASRMVTLRVKERTIAVLVEAVMGIARIEPSKLQSLPPLLAGARSDAIERIGRLDADVLVTFRLARIWPDADWSAMTTGAAGPQ